MAEDRFDVFPEQEGKTLAAFLRGHLAGQSWSQVRRIIEGRRVCIDGELCADPARRVRAGQGVKILERPAPRPPKTEEIVLQHVDADVVVVEKPAGIPTVRHPAERDWPRRRRELEPTLEDLVTWRLCELEHTPRPRFPRLRIVHRLDKHTSGLVVFARSVRAESDLGKQFHAHTVHRRYLAVVRGFLPSQTIRSRLVRDRGDGRRGSTTIPGQGKEAVTHVEVVERLDGYTLVACRLETGRTHQIRIHLSEAGCPVCGDPVYHRLRTGEEIVDRSGAPRLALHASELGFTHPWTGERMSWSMPLPPDLQQFVDGLRKRRP